MNSLPFEVVLNITKHLDLKDVLNLCCCCKEFFSLISDSSLDRVMFKKFVVDCVGELLLRRLEIGSFKEAAMQCHRFEPKFDSELANGLSVVISCHNLCVEIRNSYNGKVLTAEAECENLAIQFFIESLTKRTQAPQSCLGLGILAQQVSPNSQDFLGDSFSGGT